MPDAARRVIGRYELVKPLGLGVHLAATAIGWWC